MHIFSQSHGMAHVKEMFVKFCVKSKHLYSSRYIWRCNWIYEPLLIHVIEQCGLCSCFTAEWHTANMCGLHIFRTDSNYNVFLHRRPCFDNTKDMKLHCLVTLLRPINFVFSDKLPTGENASLVEIIWMFLKKPWWGTSWTTWCKVTWYIHSQSTT